MTKNDPVEHAGSEKRRIFSDSAKPFFAVLVQFSAANILT